jgi:hypothetical protein
VLQAKNFGFRGVVGVVEEDGEDVPGMLPPESFVAVLGFGNFMVYAFPYFALG